MTFPAHHVLGAQRNGVNHVSMNLSAFNKASGPIRNTNYPTYPDALLDWYQASGMSSVRLMFTWEAVQSSASGPVPSANARYANYWTDLVSVLTRLLARGIYVTLAPWQYNAVSKDTDIVFRGASFTAAVFADFWGKFAAAINRVTANDERVAFDLINEPHTHAESGRRAGDVGVTLRKWFTCAQAAIDGIRAGGATNTIFVPGMSYTAAASFTTNGSARAWLALTDPLENIAVSVHCYNGLGSASPTVLPDVCTPIVTWARANGAKVHIGEIAMNAGPNGRPAFCSTFATAQTQWANWNRFCVENSDVLVGWNWWGNSAAGWWNEGDSCDGTNTPDGGDDSGFHWGLTLDNGLTQTVYMDLIQSSLRAPTPCIRDDVPDSVENPDETSTISGSPQLVVQHAAEANGIEHGAPVVVHASTTNGGSIDPADRIEHIALMDAARSTPRARGEADASTKPHHRQHSWWPWIAAGVALLVLAAAVRTSRRPY